MARVVLENLSKIYETAGARPICAVNQVNLTVEDQELLVLVGPSGSGKTTTLRLIAGLEEATSGTLSIDGRVVNEVAPKDRDIAMVFQNCALYPHMTAYENMAFALKLRKLPKAEIAQRIQAAAEILGLAPCLDQFPKNLSGGQRQRVAIGRAMVRHPKAFLFDEPLSNLDAQMRAQMRQEIVRLRWRLAATMIYVTHDQVEAMILGDRIAVLKEGQIQQVADPLAVYQRPVNLFVAGFIGSPPMNFFHGELTGQGTELEFRELGQPKDASPGPLKIKLLPEHVIPLSDYVGKPIVLGLRPEAILWARSQTTQPSCRILEARVEWMESLGSETYFHLTAGSQSCIARFPAGERAALRQVISVGFDLAQAHFFDPLTELALGERTITSIPPAPARNLLWDDERPHEPR